MPLMVNLGRHRSEYITAGTDESTEDLLGEDFENRAMSNTEMTGGDNDSEGKLSELTKCGRIGNKILLWALVVLNAVSLVYSIVNLFTK